MLRTRNGRARNAGRRTPTEPNDANGAHASADELALDPGDSVGYLIRDIHRAIVQRLIRELKHHHVTLGMWFFLRALWNRDGLTQRELARAVRMTEPTAVVALKAMERRGLIGRIADPDDRRKAYIYLTPKGRKLRASVMPFIVRQNEELLRGLPAASRQEFLSHLRRMHEHVSRIVETEKSDGDRRPLRAAR